MALILFALFVDQLMIRLDFTHIMEAWMKKLSPIDVSFLTFESAETPMHIANLQIYSLPKNAGDNYIKDLSDSLRDVPELASPFNRVLSIPHPKIKFPKWLKAENIDMHYHIRHVALPKPGNDENLHTLVSQIHSQGLDRTRPLWEVYVIEGLENNRFAVLFKMHHACIDGVGGMRLMQASLSTKKGKNTFQVPWQKSMKKEIKRVRKSSFYNFISPVYSELSKQVKTIPGIIKVLSRMSLVGVRTSHPSLLPYTAPNSLFNSEISNQRNYAVTSLPLSRVKALSKQSQSTINDVSVALCSCAIRRYLLENNSLPSKSMIAQLPVSVRAADSESAGNQFGVILCDMATTEESAAECLQVITKSTHKAKTYLASLTSGGLQNLTALIMAPFSISQMLGITSKIKPAFNLLISNVPGPKEALYLNDAKLEAFYPLTLLFQGSAISLVITSYDENLNFSITGCKDIVPDINRMTGYINEAFKELEASLK